MLVPVWAVWFLDSNMVRLTYFLLVAFGVFTMALYPRSDAGARRRKVKDMKRYRARFLTPQGLTPDAEIVADRVVEVSHANESARVLQFWRGSEFVGEVRMEQGVWWLVNEDTE